MYVWMDVCMYVYTAGMILGGGAGGCSSLSENQEYGRNDPSSMAVMSYTQMHTNTHTCVCVSDKVCIYYA